MSVHLADATWTQVDRGGVVLVPVGSMEQHGPHLPIDTDTVIAEAVAQELSRRVADHDVLVAPAIAYGSSGEHQSFSGTSSIGTDVLSQVVVELTRSIRTWARRVVFINGHGGNVAALEWAVRQLLAEGHDVAWHPCATQGADLHAGLTETSLMLHLRPASVRTERIERGNTQSLGEILPAMVAGGVAAVSANGVLGDPAGASSAAGRIIFDQMVSTVLERFDGAAVA